MLTSLVEIEADRELRLDLRKPLVPWPTPPGIKITIASREQVLAAAKMLFVADGQRMHDAFLDRMQRGHKCFVALMAERVVGCNWLVTGIERDGPITFVLRPDEVLCTGAFVEPSVRGRTIHTALLHAMLDWAKTAGHIRAYTYVGVTNARSAKTHARLNWQGSWIPRYITVSSRIVGLKGELVIGLRWRKHALLC